jgi:hypothetical protein
MPNPSYSAGTQFTLSRLLGYIVAALVLVYVIDFAWYELRLHFPKLGVARDSIHRIRLLAIPNKGNRATYELDMVHPEDDVPCSHSLLPEGGANPCWYVTRHINDPIQM